MDSSKPAYEPVSTEEPATTEVEDENAGDTTPIVDSAPAEVETPPEVAEKNEKNAEKTAAAAAVVTPMTTEETAEKKKEEEPEQNGNVSLDLDSSIVPLKEVNRFTVFLLQFTFKFQESLDPNLQQYSGFKNLESGYFDGVVILFYYLSLLSLSISFFSRGLATL